MCCPPVSLCVAVLAAAVGYLLGRGSENHLSDVPLTLEEEERWCPGVVPPIVAGVAQHTVGLYQRVALYEYGEAGDFAFHPSWAGDFMITFYLSAVHLTGALYKSRHADSVTVPTKMGSTSTFRVGSVVAPDTDIDDPYYLAVEKWIPRIGYNMFFLPATNCYMGALRRLPFQDDLHGDPNNTWSPLLQNGKYKRKRDWVMSFYEPYKLMDGVSAYPTQENDLGAFFWRQDEWDDGLEQAMAFDLIGAHRLRATDKKVGEESLAFVLPLNRLAAVGVRPGFGKYGADLYFNADGLPVLIETPDGRQVKRGDKDWQYWKFVWRSTLVNSITLIDHLHLTHFRAANILARTSRKTLPPDHFIRRLLSVFTFGSIYVNNVALHTLIGPNHVLHRSTPFQEFEALSELVPTKMPSLMEWHAPMLDDEAFGALPAKIRETPYYADGRLLARALRNFLNNFLDVYSEEDCSKDGVLKNPHALTFFNSVVVQDAEAGYAGSVGATLKCADLREHVLAFLWTVTGWHRHVGTVGDYYKDPDLVGFSWKEGEAFVRPRQCMLMTVVAAFTSLPQPKINEDFSHLFKGIHKEEAALAALAKFREELAEVEATVKQRNEARRIKNPHADPSVVECSVAV